MTHPADMGDQCYLEGLRVGRLVAQSLLRQGAQRFDIPVQLDEVFRSAAPNVISVSPEAADRVTLNVRVNHYHKGEIIVRDGEKELYRGKHRCLPERRILLKNVDISGLTSDSQIRVIAR
ncbi:hypothetical protein D3C75_1053050 [compost metagenome]